MFDFIKKRPSPKELAQMMMAEKRKSQKEQEQSEKIEEKETSEENENTDSQDKIQESDSQSSSEIGNSEETSSMKKGFDLSAFKGKVNVDKLKNMKDFAEKIDTEKMKAKGKEAFNKVVSATENIQYFSFLKRVEAEKKVLVIVCLILGLVIVVQTWSMMQLMSSNRTVILPPQVSKEFWLTDTRLSHSYYEQVGFYIADRVLSYSPDTIVNSFGVLTPFFTNDRDVINKIRKQFNEQAEFVKSEKLYQTFYPVQVQVDENRKILKVLGNTRRFIDKVFVHEVQSYIDINYALESGRFVIKNLRYDYK